MVEQGFEIAMWLLALLWLLLAALQVAFMRRLRALPPAEDGEPRGVSVIIAARDEAQRIADTAANFLRQRGVTLQLLIIDDRSTDETGAILESIAATDPRLEPVRVEALPPGWLGKCHAMHRGAARARHEWLVFADADTSLLTDDVLKRAVDAALRCNADHVCLLPRLAPRTLMGKALACVCFASAGLIFDRVNRDRPRAYFGVGAFMLIRADLYRSFGGHEPLRLEVIDDVHLGLLSRRAGGRLRLLTAFDAVATTWGGDVREFIGAVEKNAFASARFNPFFVIGSVVLFAPIWMLAAAGPALAIMFGVAAPAFAFAALLLNAIPASMIARRLGFHPAVALLAPFTPPILVWAGLRSMCITLRRGGVRWRDTFYPLAELRAGRLR